MIRPDVLLLTLWADLHRAMGRDRRDRGDIPGWVLVVVMTAAIVAMLAPLAGRKFLDLFNTATDTAISAQ